ncbi:hypothetical protein [Streptomyces sp. NPDC001927]
MHPTTTAVPFETATEPSVQAQPTPRAAARIVSAGGRGIARDRLRLMSLYGDRFRRAMSGVGAALPKEWAALDSRRALDVSARADLAAVRLYLDEEWAWVDPMMLAGEPGVHMPLARCVASGLRRLPAYRGPAIVRTGVAGSLVEWYRQNPLAVDHGFWQAASSPAVLGAGGPGYVVWSLTGRRTDSVDPYATGRLVFTPGTRFKVLKVVDALDGRGARVMLREMFPWETAETIENAETVKTTKAVEWWDATTVEELTRATARPTELSLIEGAFARKRPPGLVTTEQGAA